MLFFVQAPPSYVPSSEAAQVTSVAPQAVAAPGKILIYVQIILKIWHRRIPALERLAWQKQCLHPLQDIDLRLSEIRG